MSPQEKMLLGYFARYTDVAGEFVVGRDDVATLLNVSANTAFKRMENLVRLDYVKEYKKPLARLIGYKWVWHITDTGVNVYEMNKQDCDELFFSHKSDKLTEALREARRIGKSSGKKIKRHEKQLSLFGDE